MTSSFKRVLLGLFCLFLVMPVQAMAGKQDKQPVKEKLKVYIQLDISWDIDNPGNRNKGHFNTKVQGLVVLNKNFSSEGYMGKPVFVAYQNQGLHAHYDFFKQEIEKKPPEECKGPKASVICEYQGQSTVAISPMPGGAFELGVNYMKSQFEASGMSKMVAAFSKETQKLTDYYQFGMAAKKVKIDGIRRPPNKCDHKSDDMEISFVQVGIVSAMAEDGIMSGSKSWTSKIESGTPSFTVRVRDMPEELQGSRLSPEPVAGGNVHYTVSWRFEDPKPILIQRRVKNEWRDVDSDPSLTEVVVGEKVELRGIVLPKTKDTKKGTWNIDDNPGEMQRNFIEEFKADNDNGWVLHLQSFDKPVIRFCWYRGENGVVTYTTDVDGVSETQYADFTIKRPSYSVKWKASDDSTFGVENSNFNQDLFNQYPTGNATNPSKIVSTNVGLQYNGILFQCENTSDIEGDTQWVQLLKETQSGWGRSAQGGGTSTPIKPVTVQGLDTVYPCARNNIYFDGPALLTNNMGADIINRAVDMDFELYIMFRPKGKEGEPDEENQWVPIKKIKWGWAGSVVRDITTDEWRKEASYEPIKGEGEKGEPTEKDTGEYPIWYFNTATVH